MVCNIRRQVRPGMELKQLQTNNPLGKKDQHGLLQIGPSYQIISPLCRNNVCTTMKREDIKVFFQASHLILAGNSYNNTSVDITSLYIQIKTKTMSKLAT